jgi:hypothetical protein
MPQDCINQQIEIDTVGTALRNIILISSCIGEDKICTQAESFLMQHNERICAETRAEPLAEPITACKNVLPGHAPWDSVPTGRDENE